MRKLLLISFMAVGCYFTDSGRQESYINEHPSTSLDIKKLILEGLIDVGMTREQIIASWGKPQRVTITTTRSNKIFSTLHYIRTFIYLENDIVTTIHRY